jgi:ketosteroid isomerase-like protein
MTHDDDRAAIAKTTARLLAAVNRGNVDDVLSVWAEDGELMPPNHPSIRGRAALQQYFSQLFARSRFNFTFTSSDVHVFGDVAMERVTYLAEAWRDESAKPVSSYGKGLHTYRREPGGVWKLINDIWNADGPPAERHDAG